MSKIQLLYILTSPVDSALVSHSRSLSLNGSRMRLTPGSRSLALSGYMMWCVVRFPTSFSKPRVIALFILKKEEEVEKKGVPCLSTSCICVGIDLDIQTGLRSCESWSVHRGQNLAGCQSCQRLHIYDRVMGGDLCPQWVGKWPGTFLTSRPLKSDLYWTSEDPVEHKVPFI